MVNNMENKNLLDILEIIATILGNLGIFVITAYGFWLTYFSKNIKNGLTDAKTYYIIALFLRNS